MNGFVDDQLRALLPVQVSASLDEKSTEILAWIDTAFNGGLALPRNLVADLGLVEVSYVEAILADGTSVELPLFRCIIDWFGDRYENGNRRERREVWALGNHVVSRARVAH